MDQQWAYTDSPLSNRQTRYAAQTVPPHSNEHRDQISATPSKSDTFNTSASLSRSQSLSVHSPAMQRIDYNGDKDGDVPMEDADAYNKPKQSAHTGHSRQPSAQLLQQEESAAARRYSPMNLSPTSPYAASPQQGGYQSYTPQSQSTRQSPTRGNPYMSPPNSYYSPPCKAHAFPVLLARMAKLTRDHSFPTSRAPTSSYSIDHGRRHLLPPICFDAAERSFWDKRSDITKTCSTTATSSGRWTSPQVCQMHKYQ